MHATLGIRTGGFDGKSNEFAKRIRGLLRATKRFFYEHQDRSDELYPLENFDWSPTSGRVCRWLFANQADLPQRYEQSFALR